MRPTVVILCLFGAACGRVGFDSTGALGGPIGDGGTEVEVKDGLVARYQIEGDGLSDAFGDGPTGTCDPCPVPVDSPIGQAYDFMGVEGIVIQDDGRFDGSNGFTIAMWVNPRSAGGVTFASKVFGSGFLNSWKVALRPDLEFETSDGRSVHSFRRSEEPLPGEWSHVAVSWDTTDKRTFLDGIELGSQTRTIAFDLREVLIGADQDSGSPKEFYDGLMSDLRFYDRPLLLSEIQQLAAP